VAFVTLDFETYYSPDFSLSKMTTEEYINDPRFEVIGVGIKIDDNPATWHTTDAQEALNSIDWSESAVLCHNTLFDGAILAFKYKIIPAYYFDTLSMARAKHGVNVGGSLAYLAEKYQLGEKGKEVLNALGKRRKDFTPEELDQYGRYCINDVNLTFGLFHTLVSDYFPQSELDLIDMTLRMYTEPVLYVDDALLVQRLGEIKEEKFRLLEGLKRELECDTEEQVRMQLASNPQFAEILRKFKIEPPMKTSPITGRDTYALAKNDEGFIELQEHENPFIQRLCAVRLGTKSTIEESRIERFIEIGKRNQGRIPIPLKYYGAHTGRWAGQDSVNFQNLPSRDKKKKTLKNSIMAPPGHRVINCDSSQIEARVLAWMAGQDDVVSQFAKGEDVYSIFATKIYKQPISKANPVERFVGKTCILGLGYGTGAAKLRHTLKTQPPGADLTEEKCKEIVNIYRSENDRIVGLWRECDFALKQMINGQYKHAPLGNGCVTYNKYGVRLPNGLEIKYPYLQIENEKVVYKSRKGVVSIWGGAMVENIVQALARIIVGEQMLKLRERGYRPVLTVHDAAVIVVPEHDLEPALATITKVMSTPPDWCTGLPVACEAKHGASYGDC
jgi:DNA polymerase I-like protein with 3'-5' exonuclease and polymerase domains